MGLFDFLKRPATSDQPISDSGRAHVSGFLALEEINAALQGPEGLRVYDQMYRTDPDIRRAVRMAINPIVSAAWSVQAFGGDEATPEDQEVADNLEWALGLGAQGATSPLRPRWKAHLGEALPGFVRWGYCPFEVTWTTAEHNGKTLVTPSRIGMRLPRTIYRWLLDEDHELQAIEQFLPLRGYVVIPREDLLYYRVDAEGDNYEGVSMLRPCYKPWLLKDKIERLDAIAQEREAVGLPVVFPPRAGVTSPAVLADLEAKLGALRGGELAYLIMPGPEASTVKDQGGWTFKIEGLAGGKGGRDPGPSLEHHRDAIAAAFIEEFIRLGQSGVGARATADVQEGPFNMACEALGSIPEAEANEILIPRWVALNYGPDTPLPTLSMSMAEEPLMDLREYVSELVNAGALHPDGQLEDFLRERADLPAMEPGAREEIAKQQEAERTAGIAGSEATAADPLEVAKGEALAKAKGKSAAEAKAAGAAADREEGGSTELTRTLDTPNRSDGTSADGTWPTTSGTAGVDGVPAPDEWHCPCAGENCSCDSPASCTHVPSVDSSYSIDVNPKRRRRNAGDGTDSRAPDAVDPHGGRTLARKATTRSPLALRPLRPFEQGAHLDVLGFALDNAREAFQDAGLPSVRAAAQKAAKAVLRANGAAPGPDTALQAALQGELARLRDLGYSTVVDELHHQRVGEPLPIGLSEAPKTSKKQRKRMLAASQGSEGQAMARGRLAAEAIATAIWQAISRAHLSGVNDPATLASSGERAGDAALRAAALSHSGGAIASGRQAAAAAAGDEVLGSRYTSVLDRNTCEPCREADDGVLRALDDPVRLARIPPNPLCSGGDYCRCIEVFQLRSEAA